MYMQMERMPEMTQGMISNLVGQRFIYCLGNVSGFYLVIWNLFPGLY
jgi:hypothetical protein